MFKFHKLFPMKKPHLVSLNINFYFHYFSLKKSNENARTQINQETICPNLTLFFIFAK